MSGGHRVRFAAYDIGVTKPYRVFSTPFQKLHRRSFDICSWCFTTWPCPDQRNHGPKPHPPIKRSSL